MKAKHFTARLDPVLCTIHRQKISGAVVSIDGAEIECFFDPVLLAPVIDTIETSEYSATYYIRELYDCGGLAIFDGMEIIATVCTMNNHPGGWKITLREFAKRAMQLDW